MIVAAGLTPAWQQIMRFDAVTPGEVNRAQDVHWCASGKVLNVAIALAHLGATSETVALVGGPAGEQIDREFMSLGIARHWVATHHATRICTTLIERSSGQVTELVENAGPITPAELEEFCRVYRLRSAQAQAVVLTGSLPAGVPRTLYRDLLRETDCLAVLDVRGPELLAALEARPFVVKPNREELAQTLARPLSSDAELHAGMRELNERGATWVVVTQGAKAAWARGPEGLLKISIPRVAVENPIGAGDCLAAGLAWGLVEGKPMRDSLRLSAAAAVENVLHLLPARLDPQRVAERADAITVEAL